MIDKNASRPDRAAIDVQRRELEGVTAHILQLCESELEPKQFFPEFLEHTVAALGGVAGAVWLGVESDSADPAYEINLSEALPSRDSETWIRHRNLVSQVCTQGEPTLVLPQSQSVSDFQQTNPTELRLLFAPLHDGRRLAGVVEILQTPDAMSDGHRAYIRYLVSVCESASRWLSSHSLRELQRTLPIWRRQQEFCQTVHGSLNRQATAFAIANEARRIIDCDRVSVALCRGSQCVIEAISGTDVVDRRSNSVRRLAKLVGTVVAANDELWYGGSADELCPQIESALNAYTEESLSKSVVVLPLRKPPRIDKVAVDSDEIFNREAPPAEILGALVIERFHGVLSRVEVQPSIDVITCPSALALGNALEHSSVFLLPLWRTLGRLSHFLQGHTLPKTAAAIAIVAAVVLALVLVPAELTLPASGTLEPTQSQHVYAAQSGVVRQIYVKSGDSIQTGQALAELDNPELLGEYERVLGEQQTTLEQLRAVRIRRLKASGLSAGDRVSLAGEQERLEARLASLTEELSLLRSQLAELRVNSPMTGRVATWDVDQLLKDRPVKTGHALLTVYDPSKGWQLELNVADRRVGHLTRAAKDISPRSLKVSYVLATDPGTVRSGLVQQIHPVAELHEGEGRGVRIRVAVDPDANDRTIDNPKPGMTVVGEVHCGQRSLGYVWLHEAMEAAQRFWFRFL